MLDADVTVLLDEEALAAKVAELGAAISRDYRGRELVMVGVLRGSFIFFADLVRQIALPLSVDFLGVSSYDGDTESSGVVRLTADLSQPVAGKHVILVEDIVDTGWTMEYLLDNLKTRHPASVAICTLLEKPARIKAPVEITYKGFTIPDEFVVGYGLDHGQKYRNLPFIGVLGQLARGRG